MQTVVVVVVVTVVQHRVITTFISTVGDVREPVVVVLVV